MAINTDPYVEVYIWRAKNSEGYSTTSSEGIRHAIVNAKNQVIGPERCGHISMGMFPNGRDPMYVSLWPQRNAPSTLVQTLNQDQDPFHEGTKPDVIVRLFHLNIEPMIEAFNQVKGRVEEGRITWVMDAPDDQDVTDPNHTTANCTSFVWAFLKIGGIGQGEYGKTVSVRGPKDGDFYKKVKCDLGRILWGAFDGVFWTKKHFSPYALSLRVASAAEAFVDDKQATIEIMDSDRVALEKERENSSSWLPWGVAGIATAAIIAKQKGNS